MNEGDNSALCGSDCGCKPMGWDNLNRRGFLQLAGAGTLALLGSRAPVMAGPFENEEEARLIPLDKKLSAAWVKSLTERGKVESYSGEELRFIGMPVGGLFCGTLYLGGDGRLWLWDIFNRNQEGIVPNTLNYRGVNVASRDGSAYIQPPVPDAHQILEQGFTLTTKADAKEITRTLDVHGFKSVTFTGQYPIGKVNYSDAESPVSVTLEAFSPFIPLNADDSSLPATIFNFTLHNTSGAPVEVTLSGHLENGVLHDSPDALALRRNQIVLGKGMTLLNCSAHPDTFKGAKRPDVAFEDWSQDTYQGWKVQGDTFGKGPILKANIPQYQGDVGGDSERVVNSHALSLGNDVVARDASVGQLTSQPFPIERAFINFWLGGGQHPTKTCLNLVVDGTIVRSATGQNSNRMALASFDVREFQGKSAILEIVDNERGPWGHIGVGRIWFSDQTAEETHKRRDFGTMGLALLGSAADTHSVDSEAPLDQKLVSSLGRKLQLAPNQSASVNFVLVWHFPHVPNILGGQERHYSVRFADAQAVAQFVADNFSRLAGQTKLWRDTWVDSTLPHWFLNRTFANTSTLATTTCHRFADGRFWAWEGVGCCPGTCTHVWHYAQAMGRIFPEVERDHRERVDFGLALEKDTGIIHYRAEDGNTFAVDGQAGRILSAYREHQMTRDTSFLHRVWPQVKKALQHIIDTDGNDDGLIRGPLHNTLDADWYGIVPWLCGLYHASLRAGEVMAQEVGDEEFAKRCRSILAVASRNLDQMCWKEDYGYYIHRRDQTHPTGVGAYDGCHIDQVFGQSWAWQVGLGRVMPQHHTKSALMSLWKFNFTPDVGPFRAVHKPGRWYAMEGDGGLIMVSYPFASQGAVSGEGAWSSMYFNECMSGFEHQAASHMVWEGLLTEGLAVTKAIHDRYHPRLRNPYNEIECSDHYARAMASYGTFVAACGYEHHGPQGHLGFAPRLRPENFKAAFTGAGGWGSYTQKIEEHHMRAEIDLKWGSLMLRTLKLQLPQQWAAKTAHVTLNDKNTPAKLSVGDGHATITLAKTAMLKAGQILKVSLS